MYIIKVANGSHLIGGFIQAKNCHHLKPFGLAEFTKSASL